VNEQLRKLIADLGIKRQRPKVRRPPTVPPEKDVAKGVAPPDATAAQQPPKPATPPADKPLPPTPQDLEGLIVDQVEALEAIPEFFLLRSEEEIADRNLTYRAARFYPETHQVYINLSYPSVGRLAAMLAASAPMAVPVDDAQAVARRVAEHMLVLRLGQALLYGLSKRDAQKGWNPHEQQQAIGSEVLTIIAENLPSALLDARQMFDQRLAEGQAKAAEPDLDAA
jgi:hypothetical protein